MREDTEPMPCGHWFRFWSPLEGTIAGAICFQSKPEEYGFCEICKAVEAERDACAQICNELYAAAQDAIDAGEYEDVDGEEELEYHSYAFRECYEKIKARGKEAAHDSV